MCKTMRPLFLLAAIVFFQPIFGQTDSLTHTFSEVGWTIKIPPDFKIVDSATRATNTAVGKAAIAKSSNTNANTSKLINLISISKDKLNYFNSNLNYSTAITKDNWETVDKSAKEIFFNTFIKQLPNGKIDTANAIRSIDGVDFKSFQATCLVNEKVSLHICYLSQFYKEHYFVISYFYVDNAAGTEIDDMLKNSKFEK